MHNAPSRLRDPGTVRHAVGACLPYLTQDYIIVKIYTLFGVS